MIESVARPASLRGRRPRMSLGRLARAGVYVTLFVAAVFYVIPVYLLFMTGMKTFAEAANQALMWQLPQAASFDSFAEAWRTISPNFANSFKIAVPAAIISSMVGSLNGYILAKWRFRGSETLFTLILFGMFIPYQSVLIPLLQLESAFGLYNTILGLVIIHIIYGIPITTLIFRNYYVGIPEELVEASKIDGAGFGGIYRRILLPLSIPGFVVVLIWQFTSAWNDFLFAVTLTGQNNWPITVAVNNLAGSFSVAWNVQMAGALIAALPTLVVYILLGKYFMRGLLAGSLKG
jgi:glucose/mannose transport system permease protein